MYSVIVSDATSNFLYLKRTNRTGSGLLASEHLHLDGTKNSVRDGSKGETELETNVSSEWRFASLEGDGSDIPGLRRCQLILQNSRTRLD